MGAKRDRFQDGKKVRREREGNVGQNSNLENPEKKR